MWLIKQIAYAVRPVLIHCKIYDVNAFLAITACKMASHAAIANYLNHNITKT